MPNLMNVPRTEWQAFFDRMSKALVGTRAEIEVASLDLGDQIVAEWVPLVGITYDSRDDLLDVALERTSHEILHPTMIAVEESATGLASVAVVDAEGERQVIRFRTPISLPPASA
jgi:hypothetical protein